MVYGITDFRHIKIGTSKNPEKRLKDLQTASPLKLSLAWQCKGDYKLESQIHMVLEDHRVRDSE